VPNRYGMGGRVAGTFDEVVARVREAFREEGFGVVTEMEVRATLKAKLGLEMEPYLVLGMCNPSLASRAIALEPDLGLLLPCNVLVRQAGGEVHVRVMDPLLMMTVTGNPALAPLGEEARAAVDRALKSLFPTSV